MKKFILPAIALLAGLMFCLSVLPADPSAADGVDNDQGTVTYYTYTVDFQFQGTDAQWIQWDFGFKDSNNVEVTSTEWNPSGIVFPGKGTYTVVQTVGNTVGTYVSQLRINIMGTPEITFESNGGSSVPMQTVKVGNKVTEPSNPVKDGYTFAGWYKESSLLNRYSFDQPVTQHMTLYAKWTSGAPSDGGNSGGNDTPNNGGDNDTNGGDDGKKDDSKTSSTSAATFNVAGIDVDSTGLSIFIILIGGALFYLGNRNENDKVRIAGIAIAAIAILAMLFGIDIVSLLGLGGGSQ